MTEHRACWHSPIGTIEIMASERGLTAIHFTHREADRRPPSDPYVAEAIGQLREYFRGERKDFSLKLHLQGTEFQRKVWRALLQIPCGQTASYKEMAGAIGSPRSSRAVGQANHRNPISIVVPCHRIIGGDGRLVGYGGGLWRKKWLLAHEKNLSKAFEKEDKA